MSLILRHNFWIFLILLAACGITGPQPAGKATETIVTTVMPFPQTPTSAPMFTPFPTFVPAGPTPLPTLLPKFPLDGYVMVFVKDGDLYFQDGNNSPIKLAHIETKNGFPDSPGLSDDNQKAVFVQDDGSVDSINTDGTKERTVIPNGWLDSFLPGTQIAGLNFIPHTHQLYVETVQCKPQSPPALCPTSVFIGNTDTGEIRKLADLGSVLGNVPGTEYFEDQHTNVVISPDGKMLAVGTIDGVEIFSLDGKILRRNVLPTTTSKPYISFPYLSWLPDSSGLIVALSNVIYHDYYFGDIAAYTVWRYTISNNAAEQILLDPIPPVNGAFRVSPDGRWVV